MSAADTFELPEDAALDAVYEVANGIARFIEENVADEQNRQRMLTRLDALVADAEDSAHQVGARQADLTSGEPGGTLAL